MNELRLIRHAIALGRHGNFARAAEALHLTQPSLSRGIAELERWLGVRLFDRTRRGVVPTAFGRLLIERGALVLRSEAALRRELQLLAGLELGNLVIGAGPMASEVSVAAAIARVARAHPRLNIQCRTTEPDEVIRDVLEERVDVGVARVTGLEGDERLDIERLPPLRLYLACRPGHPLAGRERLTWAQAMEFPLVTSVLRGAHAALVAQGNPTVVDDEGTPDYVPQFLVNSPAVARLIARDSDGLFPGTANLIADDVAAGHLVKLPVDAAALRTVHGIITLRNRTLSPAAHAFMDSLRDVEAGLRSADTRVPDTVKVRGDRVRRLRSADSRAAKRSA